MKSAVKGEIEGERIDAKSFLPVLGICVAALKKLMPLRPLQVVVRELNLVAAIANPIHEAKRRTGGQALYEMVFDDHASSSDA